LEFYKQRSSKHLIKKCISVGVALGFEDVHHKLHLLFLDAIECSMGTRHANCIKSVFSSYRMLFKRLLLVQFFYADLA
jgi:hypothetical protein